MVPLVFTDLLFFMEYLETRLADRFPGVLFVRGDIGKLTGPLEHKPVFVNCNVFYFIFNRATVDID